MRLWIERNHYQAGADGSESPIYIGLYWYKHAADLPWKGFTIKLYLFDRMYVLIMVNNYKEYDKAINRRWGRHAVK
mgnify:CR=1 FL=1